METNTPNETSVKEKQDVVAAREEQSGIEAVAVQPEEKTEQISNSDEPAAEHDPNHPHHHNSALGAAHKAHSAVDHVLPHHRGIDI